MQFPSDSCHSAPPPFAQISSSAPYFQTPSTYVLPIILDTLFHAQIKQQAKLQLRVFCS